MNNTAFKVCPLCGANSILLHGIIDSIGKKYYVESKVSCTSEKDCGVSLRRVTPLPQEKVEIAPHKATTEDLERIEEIQLVEVSLLEQWNKRDAKFIYTKNTY